MKPVTIVHQVGEVLAKYWAMAGFEIRSGHHRYVDKIVKSYQSLLKDKSRESEKVNADRNQFMTDCLQLLDIGHPELEEKLQ